MCYYYDQWIRYKYFLISRKGEDTINYPAELEQLLMKKILFKINIKETKHQALSEKTYQVQKICIDYKIVQDFQRLHNLEEVLCIS